MTSVRGVSLWSLAQLLAASAWVLGLDHLRLPGSETLELSSNSRRMDCGFFPGNQTLEIDSTLGTSSSFPTNTVFMRTDLPMEIWQDFTFWRHCTFLHMPWGLRSWASQEMQEFPRIQEVQGTEKRGAQQNPKSQACPKMLILLPLPSSKRIWAQELF